MILGGGVYQLPLIKASLKRNFFTIVVTPEGPYPGIEIADLWINADTSDIETVLNKAKELHIDAILTTGTDVATPTIGRVVDELALHGCGYQAARLCSSKVHMKKAFQDFNIPTARYALIKDESELFEKAAHFSFPLMIKAPDSSGSRGIIKVQKKTDLLEAYREAKRHSKSGAIIAEEFLNGIEFGAQAIILENEVLAVLPHNDILQEGNIPTPIGHSLPFNCKSEDFEKIKEIVTNTVEVLGLKNTIANVDLMLCEDKIYIIEVGARMGATCIPELLSLYYQFDIYDFLLDLALGKAKPFTPNPSPKATAALLLKSQRSGILKEVIIPPHLTDNPDIHKISIDKAPKDKIEKFTTGPHRVGEVIVVDKSIEAAEKSAHIISKKIKFHLYEQK